MKRFIALLLIVGLAACTSKNHVGEGIEISAAYVVPPFPGRDISAGYFELTNHGAPDRLVSISSPMSPRTELHTHLNDNGVMKMRKVDGLDLPSGETVVFKPGGYHIMMFDHHSRQQQTS